MAAAQAVQQDPTQAAGKALLLYTFSCFKTGEIHDLNNDAWKRPIEKLQEALDILSRKERQGITMVIYEGVVMINSNALWLDRGSSDQADEMEQWLAKRESGGISFAEMPDEEALRRFFFTCSRHRFPDDVKDPIAHVGEAVAAAGVENIRLIQRPVRLEGVGRGVRGVATLWHYAKCMAALEDLVTRSPVDNRALRRIGQELVDACAMEQDLMCGLMLTGQRESPGRWGIDLGILLASVGRGLGLTAVECVDLAEAGLTHGAGLAYENPAPKVYTVPEAAGIQGLRQLLDAYRVSPGLAHRVAASIEYALGPTGDGPPYLAGPPRAGLAGQLIALGRLYLSQVRGIGKGRAPKSPISVAMRLLENPPPQVEPGLVRVFIAVVGLFPVGTLLELSNGDIAVVADIDHLRGRTVYRQSPPPVCQPPTVYVERMRSAEGRVIAERKARVALGAEDGKGGHWVAARSLDPRPHRDLVLRALIRRPATVISQMGLR